MTECNAINSKVLQHDRTNTGKKFKSIISITLFIAERISDFTMKQLHAPEVGKENNKTKRQLGINKHENARYQCHN